MSDQPKLAVGQIWKDLDPRVDRHVRIEGVGTGRRSVAISSVEQKEGNWARTARSRVSYADSERFNGKRGNYGFVEHPHA